MPQVELYVGHPNAGPGLHRSCMSAALQLVELLSVGGQVVHWNELLSHYDAPGLNSHLRRAARRSGDLGRGGRVELQPCRARPGRGVARREGVRALVDGVAGAAALRAHLHPTTKVAGSLRFFAAPVHRKLPVRNSLILSVFSRMTVCPTNSVCFRQFRLFRILHLCVDCRAQLTR